MTKILMIAAGSLAGGFSRYYLAGLIHRIFGTGFPYGTLAVNFTGCFLIGFFSALADEKFLMSPNTRILLMIGFCGAFTTFSTWVLETSHLIRDGDVMRAFLNVFLSVVVGFFIFRCGVLVGEWV